MKSLCLSASSARFVHLMILLMAICVTSGCALSQASLESQGTTPLSSIDGNASAQSKVTTNQGDVQGKTDCCITGTFYTTKYFPTFMSTDLGKQIQKDYTMSFCAAAPLLGAILEGGDAKAFCDCDCQHTHGASQSDLKCDGTRDYPCLCTYTSDDEKQFQTSCKRNEDEDHPKSTEVQPQPSQEHPTHPAPKYDEFDYGHDGGNKSVGETSATCQLLVSQVVVKLACDDAVYTLDDNGTKIQILPQDICALDCVFSHGRKVKPYGRCCYAKDGEMYCKCVE